MTNTVTKKDYANIKKNIKFHINKIKTETISSLSKTDKKILKDYQIQLALKFIEEADSIQDDIDLHQTQIQLLANMASNINNVQQTIKYAHLVNLLANINSTGIQSLETYTIIHHLPTIL